MNDTNSEVWPAGCSMMCLVDGNFKNLPPGDVVDKLIGEWKTANVSGVTDKNGIFEERVFLGEYSLTYSYPPLIPQPVTKMFNVTSRNAPLQILIPL